MKRALILLSLLSILAAAGCGPGDAGKATTSDKSAIDKLTTEGISPSKPPTSDNASTPTPANGNVSPP